MARRQTYLYRNIFTLTRFPELAFKFAPRRFRNASKFQRNRMKVLHGTSFTTQSAVLSVFFDLAVDSEKLKLL